MQEHCDTYSMKPSLQDTLYPWLESREELLWAGRPDPLRMAKARMGIAVAGLAVSLLIALTPLQQCFTSFSPNAGEALTTSQSDIHIIEAIPFSLLLGALVLVLQPFAAYYYAGRTSYAVTGRRLFMVRKDMLGILVKTAKFDAIEAPLLRQRSDGTDDIYFYRKTNIPENDRGPSPLTRFLGLREADHVHQLISNRLMGSANGQAQAEPVQDYLAFLLKGEKRLDDVRDR